EAFCDLHHFTGPTVWMFSSLTCGMDNSRVTGTGIHGVRRPSPRWSSRTSCQVSSAVMTSDSLRLQGQPYGTTGLTGTGSDATGLPRRREFLLRSPPRQ